MEGSHVEGMETCVNRTRTLRSISQAAKYVIDFFLGLTFSRSSLYPSPQSYLHLVIRNYSFTSLATRISPYLYDQEISM